MAANAKLKKVFPFLEFEGECTIEKALKEACEVFGFEVDTEERNTIIAGGDDFVVQVYGDHDYMNDVDIFEASFRTFAPRVTVSSGYFPSIMEALQALAEKTKPQPAKRSSTTKRRVK